MEPAEIPGRVRTAVRVYTWRRYLDTTDEALLCRRFTATLPPGVVDSVPVDALAGLVGAADRIMDGYAEYFGVVRDDMVCPDWSLDPKTGRRAPADAYAFDVRYRDEQTVGDVKQLWEPSRHQHLTVLAAAYAGTGDDRYAYRVACHLKSWWAANPPMRGVHWVSGIEIGTRLLSWVWVRRLLDGWPGAPGLFEDNPESLHQIRFHQRWLAAFPSRGSSANNHVIAELAGQLVAACAFPWFPESQLWAREALRSLDDQLDRNTFPSGLNRELATEYHGLVLELGLAAAIEADAAGLPVPDTTWRTLTRMCDALAAVVDVRLQPPRQGDADDGRGLVLDDDDTDRWASLLATGEALFGSASWWPAVDVTDVRTPLLTSLVRPRPMPADRPPRRPHHLADAGLTILRTPADAGSGEVWCRCDGGPHGFLSIAAHAHADALSLEVRHDGVDVIADPGTYCYHGEPRWRSYFRSTRAHSTLELDGRDQSTSGGPFLWTRQARTRVVLAESDSTGISRWRAEHDGYGTRGRPVVHRRDVELEAPSRALRIRDEVRSNCEHRWRLSFHLGPLVVAELDGIRALLRWPGGGNACLELPGRLVWSAHRGEVDPPLGWYSPGFGRREPAVTLVGVGVIEPGAAPLCTTLRFGRWARSQPHPAGSTEARPPMSLPLPEPVQPYQSTSSPFQ